MFTEIFGISMGIYLTDLLLRPRFQGGAVEVVLFIVQGAIAYMLYHWLKCTGDNSDVQPLEMAPGKMLLGAGIGGAVLFFTDMMLRVNAFYGFGNEIFKFLIQGTILWFTYSSFAAAILHGSSY